MLISVSYIRQAAHTDDVRPVHQHHGSVGSYAQIASLQKIEIFRAATVIHVVNIGFDKFKRMGCYAPERANINKRSRGIKNYQLTG